MTAGTVITGVRARQIFSDRGHPGVEAKVLTASGAVGVAIATAGISIGEHEIQFVYDNDPKRYNGKGVLKAVAIVNDIIGPKIKGLDACNQREIDQIMLDLDGTKLRTKLGGNATAAVSAAVLKAAAAGLGIPLYQHVGGVNACILPTPGVGVMGGSERYGGSAVRSGGKPSYSLMAHGFKTFTDASYACYEVKNAFDRLMKRKYRLEPAAQGSVRVGPGVFEHDEEAWQVMTQAIDESGNKDKVGIQVDAAATTYYNKEKDIYEGLFSKDPKTKGDLIKLYQKMEREYPFVILEDPLHENDYAGHAEVVKALGIQVVGDDLFTTNMARLKEGIAQGSANTMLLKVNQIGTISEAFDSCNTAFRAGWGVMPCSSRGEGPDIGDYAVGLNTGNIRESGLGPSGNRLLEIEEELGERAQFLGRAGFKGIKNKMK
jgi:enolase